MSIALYRKYRPQTFSALVGQDAIRQTLLNQVIHGKVAHAYLFSGPRGIGKTTTARLLARAINCAKPHAGEPDNSCEFCKEILDGRSLDIIEIDAASNTGVDHVREHIIENARFTPQRLKVKVFIIDEVHMLSISAFNALLKTLEEPPKHAMFILATTEVHRVPETIISRCQRFDFKRISVRDLVGRLQSISKQEGVQIAEPVLRSIARRAAGASRDAEVLLAQLLTMGEKKITEEQADIILPRSDVRQLVAFIKTIIERQTVQALDSIGRLVEEGANVPEMTDDLVELLRKMLVARARGGLDEFEQGDLDEDVSAELVAMAKGVSIEELIRMIETFLEKKKESPYVPLPQLTLELAVLTLLADDMNAQPPKETPRKPHAVQQISTPRKTAPKASAEAVQPPPVVKAERSPELATITEKWDEILKTVREHHRGMYLVIRPSRPVDMKGSVLYLGFPFKLLAEQARNDRNRPIIEQVIAEVTGMNVSIESQVSDALPAERVSESSDIQPGAPASGWKELLDAIGGEVVAEE